LRSIVAVVVVVLVLLAVGAALLSDSPPPPGRHPRTAPAADPVPPPVTPEEVPAEPAPRIGLPGLVLDTAGKPAAAGIVVTARAENETDVSLTATTDSDGSWTATVPPGESVRVYGVSARDPRTGDAAGVQYVETRPGAGARFTVLRLRTTGAVTGRVIGENGRPVPDARVRVVGDDIRRGVRYRSELADRREVEARLRTDSGGRFRVLLPSRLTGRAAALGEDGVSGPIRRFDFARAGVTDVGDLPFRNERSAEWTLRFEGEAGGPLTNVDVFLALDLLWHAKVHPRDGLRDGGGIAADDEGRVRLVLPCRSIPATIVARCPTHRGRILALDLRREGPSEARVRLAPRPFVRVHITGTSAKEILPTIEYVDAHPVTMPKRTRALSALDPTTGSEVPIPEPARKWCELMHEPWRPNVERTGLDRIDMWAPPGQYRIQMENRFADWTLGPVTMAADDAGRTVEVVFPTGRLITLDLRKLNRWASRDGTRHWVTGLAAWPLIVSEELSGSFVRNPGPTLLLGGEETGAPETRRIWMPEGYDAVAFGYPEDPVLNDDVGLRRAGVVPVPDTNRIEVPVPEGTLAVSALVWIRIHRKGAPFRQAGVPVRIYGRDRGVRTFLTNAEGDVTVRLFGGTYHAAIEGFGVRSSYVGDWPRFEVGPPFDVQEFVLDFEFSR